MKLPWSKPEVKTSKSWIALSALPQASWGRSDAATLARADLSSASGAAVLSGVNRALIEHEAGWELVGWRHAELVATDRWRLSGLIRGLSGSPIRAAEAGRQFILADDRLVALPLGRDQYGQTFLAQIEAGDTIPFTYQDRAALPWRVGHLRAQDRAGVRTLSWTARGPQYSNNWALTAPETETAFQVELYAGDTLVSRSIQRETEFQLAHETADRVRVAEISTDGRMGEWGSIPL